MKLTNKEIYDYAQRLIVAFSDSQQRIPVKLNFSIQKNKKVLLELAQDIEASRMEIANTYGTFNEDTLQYDILPSNVAAVQQELADLFDIEQEINICMIKADSLSDDFMLTTAQMEAIMFMIEEV